MGRWGREGGCGGGELGAGRREAARGGRVWEGQWGVGGCDCRQGEAGRGRPGTGGDVAQGTHLSRGAVAVAVAVARSTPLTARRRCHSRARVGQGTVGSGEGSEAGRAARTFAGVSTPPEPAKRGGTRIGASDICIAPPPLEAWGAVLVREGVDGTGSVVLPLAAGHDDQEDCPGLLSLLRRSADGGSEQHTICSRRRVGEPQSTEAVPAVIARLREARGAHHRCTTPRTTTSSTIFTEGIRALCSARSQRTCGDYLQCFQT
jgi:hypothetical protein